MQEAKQPGAASNPSSNTAEDRPLGTLDSNQEVLPVAFPSLTAGMTPEQTGYRVDHDDKGKPAAAGETDHGDNVKPAAVGETDRVDNEKPAAMEETHSDDKGKPVAVEETDGANNEKPAAVEDMHEEQPDVAVEP